MDEYKEYLYQRRPHYRSIDPGDLTDQLAIRTKLNCKPFSWFMKHVAFDLTKKYPPVEPPVTAEGEVLDAFFITESCRFTSIAPHLRIYCLQRRCC